MRATESDVPSAFSAQTKAAQPGCGRAGLLFLATTYSRGTCRPTTIGAAAFHFRVRDGNGWFHRAMVTRGAPEVWVIGFGVIGFKTNALFSNFRAGASMRTFVAGNRMKRMMGKNAAGRGVLRTGCWLLS